MNLRQFIIGGLIALLAWFALLNGQRVAAFCLFSVMALYVSWSTVSNSRKKIIRTGVVPEDSEPRQHE